MNRKQLFGMAVMFAAVVFWGYAESEKGSANPGSDDEPPAFELTGSYSLIVDGKKCTLEFKNDGTYVFTGYDESVDLPRTWKKMARPPVVKEGKWAMVGNEVAMTYSDWRAIDDDVVREVIVGYEVFIAEQSNSDITLTMTQEYRSIPISLVLISFGVSTKSVMLTKK